MDCNRILCSRVAREARQLAGRYEEPQGFDDLVTLGQIPLQEERRFLGQLGELRRPRAGRALIRQMLGLYEAHHRWFRRTVDALRRNDIGPALRAGQREDELSNEAGDILAFQLRATKCGVGGGGSGNGQILRVVSTG
jgi:hypothetical protein